MTAFVSLNFICRYNGCTVAPVGFLWAIMEALSTDITDIDLLHFRHWACLMSAVAQPSMYLSPHYLIAPHIRTVRSQQQQPPQQSRLFQPGESSETTTGGSLLLPPMPFLLGSDVDNFVELGMIEGEENEGGAAAREIDPSKLVPTIDPPPEPSRKRRPSTPQLRPPGAGFTASPWKCLKPDAPSVVGGTTGGEDTNGVGSGGGAGELDELDRQSLVDIAKAATAAMMQRASPSALSRQLKSRSQQQQQREPVCEALSFDQQLTPSKSAGGGGVVTKVSDDVVPSSPAKTSPSRTRVKLSPQQKARLMSMFRNQPYPTALDLRSLSRDLVLPYKTVSVAFNVSTMPVSRPLSTVQ